MISLDQYVSAGYFVTRLIPRPCVFSSELLPQSILSACSCICDFVPDSWCIAWADSDDRREKEASKFRIDAVNLTSLIEFVTTEFGRKFGWPNVCFTRATAEEIASRFVPPEVDPLIFGLGLHESLIDEFCEYAKPKESPPGYAPIGESGIRMAVKNRAPLDPQGHSLGFELLAFEYGLDHSWLCNRLEKEIDDKLHVRPNEHGFIQTFQDALLCSKYIGSPDVGAEPGLWLPWLVVRY